MVARHPGETRASGELRLTRLVISMQITQLEEVVGLSPFEQVGEKIFLAGAGSNGVR